MDEIILVKSEIILPQEDKKEKTDTIQTKRMVERTIPSPTKAVPLSTTLNKSINSHKATSLRYDIDFKKQNSADNTIRYVKKTLQKPLQRPVQMSIHKPNQRLAKPNYEAARAKDKIRIPVSPSEEEYKGYSKEADTARVKPRRMSLIKTMICGMVAVFMVLSSVRVYDYVYRPVELLGLVAALATYPEESISQVSGYLAGIGEFNTDKDNSIEETQTDTIIDDGQVDKRVIGGLDKEEEIANPQYDQEVEEDKPNSAATTSKNDGVVTVMTYKGFENDNTFGIESGFIKNLTHLSNAQVLALSKAKPRFKIAKNKEPQVLIMHTHATESFLPNNATTFDTKMSFRTTDNSRNTVSVGAEIASVLNNSGIVTLQDKTQHDYPSYTGSYERSAVTVKSYLKKYPSIKVVLDVHRDSIAKTDKNIVSPVAMVNGKEAAQVMIISGCDNGKMNMPKYKENLKFASLLQQTLESSYPGVTRPILFDYRKYNQDLTTGSLLLEVGSHGNTHEQVIYSAQLVGNALVKALSGL